MRLRRPFGALALGLAGAMSIAGCSNAGESSGPVDGLTLSYASESDFTSYNSGHMDHNSTYNALVLNQVVRGFYTYDGNATLQQDADFGSYKKVSDDPLTVEYTINEDAVWSDGNPIDCDDAVFAWMVGQPAASEDGGYEGGFQPASTSGTDLQKKPVCADGDKTFTIEYTKAYAEWDTLVGGFLPAHKVEEKSGVADVIAAADDLAGEDIGKLAEVYNNGFQAGPGEVLDDMWLSAGPYKIASWEANAAITLERNDKWWGEPGVAENIIVRIMGGDAMVPALVNGEVDVMAPQPQVELINQLEAAGDKAEYTTGDEFAYEHMDFNHASGVMKDKNIREAFAKCVPRQDIVDKLVKPTNSNAVVMNSRVIFPFQNEYDSVKGAGAAYDKVDIEGAKALLAEAGVDSVDVTVGWQKDTEGMNQRRFDQLALTIESCKEAGINVIDGGSPDFFETRLSDGSWDIAMFAWGGSPTLLPNQPIFASDGEQNFGGYENSKVDGIFETMETETDPAKAKALVGEADAVLWEDLATLPLYAFPAVVAHTAGMDNVVLNPTQFGVTWNADKWSVS